MVVRNVDGKDKNVGRKAVRKSRGVKGKDSLTSTLHFYGRKDGPRPFESRFFEPDIGESYSLDTAKGRLLYETVGLRKRRSSGEGFET